MATLDDKRKFYIDGAWVAPATARDLEVIDPSTEEPFAVISLGAAAVVTPGVPSVGLSAATGIPVEVSPLSGRGVVRSTSGISPRILPSAAR